MPSEITVRHWVCRGTEHHRLSASVEVTDVHCLLDAPLFVIRLVNAVSPGCNQGCSRNPNHDERIAWSKYVQIPDFIKNLSQRLDRQTDDIKNTNFGHRRLQNCILCEKIKYLGQDL